MSKPELGHEFKILGLTEDGKERVDLVITSRYDLISLARETAKQNAEAYREDGKRVWTPFGRMPLNEEYLERDRVTKELRKTLKKYSSSSEYASDELFRIKKQAEEQGKDFVQVASYENDKIEGRLFFHSEDADPDAKAEYIKGRKGRWGYKQGTFQDLDREESPEPLKPTWFQAIKKRIFPDDK